MARRRSRLGLLSPTLWLKRNALRKGLLGGRAAWTVVLVFLYTPKLLKRIFGRTEESLGREKLEPGQFVRVEALTGLSKPERKAILKAK